MLALGPHHLRVMVLSAIAAAIAIVAAVAFDPAQGAQGSRPAALSAAEIPSAAAATQPQAQLVASRDEVAPTAGEDGVGAATAGRDAPRSTSGDATRAKAGAAARATPQLVVDVPASIAIRSGPGRGRVLGTMPARSKYLGTPMSAWVVETTADNRFGRVVVPWSGSTVPRGWIRLQGLSRHTTRYVVRASLSRRRIVVERLGRRIFSMPAAVGASTSPSPTGLFFVTDRIDVPASQPQFGSFAFGLSGIQPNTPPGWTGGNQMAIHGTSSPSSIGTAASAGCLRVSEQSLARLKPLLALGTPVIIER